MADEETIRVYDTKATDYAKRFSRDEPSGSLKGFMSCLPPGAAVLDWGCGPGMASSHLRDAGFLPDPVDASPEMVALAREHQGLPARLGTFDDPLEKAAYQGVWANFSLLHAERTDFPGHLANLHDCLQPQGILHLGMKRGSGANRDKFGRYYTFYETEELATLLQAAGFEILKVHEGEEAGLAGTVDPFVLMLSRKTQVPVSREKETSAI
ncbi:MAG: class I SAM-dependent methyltransferase [Roseibium sp.]|nr:class I SAM-dependent methyltransferase [Roseibium sp.]